MSAAGAENAAPPAPPRRVRPLLVIRAEGRGFYQQIAEGWRFRRLLVTFADRELRVRYRQTALGVTWFGLQPLVMAAAFAFVFGSLARMPEERAPRLVFTFAGVLAWNLFSYIVTRGSQPMVQNAPLITKVFFPREVLPLSLVLPGLVDFAITLVLLLAIAAAHGVWPGWGLLLLPVWIVLLCLLACGWALITAALTVWYRDLQFVVQLGMQLLLYVSPLAFSLDAIPERFRVLVMLNPL